MSRMLLRLLNAPILILICCIGIAIQTSLFTHFPLNYMQPDVVLLIVFWIALKRPFTEGGILTLILANIAEIHSSAPQGTLLATYLIIFLLLRWSSDLLVLPRLTSLVFLTLVCSLFVKILFYTLLALLGIPLPDFTEALLSLFPSAATEGFFAIWAFRWLDRLDWSTYKNARARVLEDELQLEGEGL